MTLFLCFVLIYIVIGTMFVMRSIRILEEEGETITSSHMITIILVGSFWPVMTLLVMLHSSPKNK